VELSDYLFYFTASSLFHFFEVALTSGFHFDVLLFPCLQPKARRNEMFRKLLNSMSKVSVVLEPTTRRQQRIKKTVTIIKRY
jgi:hypothetical protein